MHTPIFDRSASLLARDCSGGIAERRRVTSPRSPRQVFCPAADLRRERVVATNASGGEFAPGGMTVDTGAEAACGRTDVHADREWWIEWSKFYYGLDLAAAYADSGDADYLRRWERLLRSWIQQVPAGSGPREAIGRRLQNWIYAWNAFEADGRSVVASGVAEEIVGGIAAQADYLEAHLAHDRNQRTLDLYALFIVALALPDLDRSGERLRFAWHALGESLRADFRPDGVHRDHSTHYHLVALRSLVAARENASRFGLAVPCDYDERLARAAEFAAWCQRPDGTVPALSDSDAGDHRETLGLAADLLQRPDLLYVASNGRRGVPPASVCASFDAGGYHVQRSGWHDLAGAAPAHRHLVFDCGALGEGSHGHYDLLSVDAWAGAALVVDPGRYTYGADAANLREWFKGTRAHNTVCVDGLDQMPYRSGKPRGAQPEARLIARASTPLVDVVGGEARSPSYDALHRRFVLFVAKEYWLVIDELSAPTSHDYDLRWHLAPAAWGHTSTGDGRTVTPAVTLVIDGAESITCEPGWVSPLYGIKQAAPVISAQRTGCTHARFVTAIVPACMAGAATMELTVSGTGSAADLQLTVRCGSVVDVIEWDRGGAVIAAHRTE